MAKTVSLKKFEAMKASANSARKRAREGRSEMKRRATLAGSAFVLGKLEQSGMLERIPTVAGIPRTIMAGVIAGVAGQFVKGTAGDVLDGIADSAIAITGYQWGKGESVGDDPMYNPATAAIVDPLPGLVGAGEMDDLEDEIAGYEDALLGDED